MSLDTANDTSWHVASMQSNHSIWCALMSKQGANASSGGKLDSRQTLQICRLNKIFAVLRCLLVGSSRINSDSQLNLESDLVCFVF